MVEAILEAGISAISIDYRLTPRHLLPAQMEDVARAVQFVRSKALTWNLDPTGRRDPPVPAAINDPHSAWQSVLLAEAMRKAGPPITCRVGPEVRRNPEADQAAILKFLGANLRTPAANLNAP